MLISQHSIIQYIYPSNPPPQISSSQLPIPSSPPSEPRIKLGNKLSRPTTYPPRQHMLTINEIPEQYLLSGTTINNSRQQLQSHSHLQLSSQIIQSPPNSSLKRDRHTSIMSNNSLIRRQSIPNVIAETLEEEIENGNIQENILENKQKGKDRRSKLMRVEVQQDVKIERVPTVQNIQKVSSYPVSSNDGQQEEVKPCCGVVEILKRMITLSPPKYPKSQVRTFYR